MTESNLNKQLSSLLPDSLIELFEIDFSSMQQNFEQLKDMYGINIGADSVYRFCSSINSSNPIVWRGKSYQPIPIKAEGFDNQNDGRFPRPRLIISNAGGIFSKIVYSNRDFVGCKVIRKRTYLRFLDDENFQGRNLNSQGNNPFGKSDEDSFLPEDQYYINRKISENIDAIVFELSSPLELQNSWLPARNMYADLCTWEYRCDIGCSYKGLPIESENGQDLRENFSFNGGFGSVNPDLYPGGIDDIPEWSKFGRTGQSGSAGGYNLGDIVQIISKQSSNPYKNYPNVFVCIQSHAFPSDHHPYFDKEFWLKDECSKTLKACRKRFEENDDFNDYNKIQKIDSFDQGWLRFGGFPGIAGFDHEA